MTGQSPRVVMLSIDAFNPRYLLPEVTPTLWTLAAEGGYAPAGGWCDLPAATYVSHATMLTGVSPARHRVITNALGDLGYPRRPTWAGSPVVMQPTIFDLLEADGIRTAGVFGDQMLVKVVRAEAATLHWPPRGEVPTGVATDQYGYCANGATTDALLEVLADTTLSFVFGHLNQTDTIGHIYGPDALETRDAYASTDADIARLLDALRPMWDETVVIVVSDHGMEPLDPARVIDLDAVPGLDLVIDGWSADGGAAVVHLRDGIEAPEGLAAMRRIAGIATVEVAEPSILVAAVEPGAVFHRGPVQAGSDVPRGFHGGPATQRTLSLVGGGHPAARTIGMAIGAAPPHLRDWVPTIAALYGISVGDSDGVVLGDVRR